MQLGLNEADTIEEVILDTNAGKQLSKAATAATLVLKNWNNI
jgi:hypothetical protein